MPQLRRAEHRDIPVLSRLIEESVRVLQRATYTPCQIELALVHIYGVDTALVDDGTYFVVDVDGEIAACGGWSKRAQLYGGDRMADRRIDLLDPAVDAAKIRAFFVRPLAARRGLGSLILAHCEADAIAAGFTRFEIGSTLAGVPFYEARGYAVEGTLELALPQGESLPIIRMRRVVR